MNAASTALTVLLVLAASADLALCKPDMPAIPFASYETLAPQTAQPDQGRGAEGKDYRRIFSDIEHGIASGSIEAFSRFMGAQVRLNLRGGESGYYSSSQAYYILENYFKTRKLVNFEFATVGESDSNPYATGSAGFNYKGNREYVQVYVSLSYAANQWVITQINIY